MCILQQPTHAKQEMQSVFFSLKMAEITSHSVHKKTSLAMIIGTLYSVESILITNDVMVTQLKMNFSHDDLLNQQLAVLIQCTASVSTSLVFLDVFAMIY